MKNCLILVLTIAFAVPFAGCSSDGGSTSIIGTWVPTMDSCPIESITFIDNESGSFVNKFSYEITGAAENTTLTLTVDFGFGNDSTEYALASGTHNGVVGTWYNAEDVETLTLFDNGTWLDERGGETEIGTYVDDGLDTLTVTIEFTYTKTDTVLTTHSTGGKSMNFAYTISGSKMKLGMLDLLIDNSAYSISSNMLTITFDPDGEGATPLSLPRISGSGSSIVGTWGMSLMGYSVKFSFYKNGFGAVQMSSGSYNMDADFYYIDHGTTVAIYPALEFRKS